MPPATTAPAATASPVSPTGAPGAEAPVVGSPYSVVLVAAEDTLALRAAPGAAARQLDGLLNVARGVRPTGRTARVGGATWWQVRADGRTGWVNSRFLAREVSATAFRRDEAVDARLEQLVDVVDRRGDLTPVVSRKGLTVASFAAPVSVPAGRLAGVLRSTEQQPVGGPGCAPDGCSGTVHALFRDCADHVRDAGGSTTRDTVVGPRSAAHPVDYQAPFELANFHYAAVLRSSGADDASWTACYFFFTYEQGRPVLAGLTRDAPRP